MNECYIQSGFSLPIYIFNSEWNSKRSNDPV